LVGDDSGYRTFSSYMYISHWLPRVNRKELANPISNPDPNHNSNPKYLSLACF